MNEHNRRQRIPGETPGAHGRRPEVSVRNDGRTARHIPGTGITVLPGETRMVPAHLVPRAAAPAPRAPEPEAPDQSAVVAAWLAHSIADIRKLLPVLTLDDIDALEAGENAAERPRTGLLSALQEARMQRAADEEQEEFRAAVRTMDREELQTHAELVADDPQRLEIIEAALATLDAGDDGGQSGSE